MKGKLIGRLMILGVFSCCCCQVLGQEKFDVAWGVDFPNLLNFGVRYQLSQAQIGVSLGFIPFIDEGMYSISSNVYYHFGGKTKLSERHPWYARIDLNYLRHESMSSIDNNLFLNLRIGRDLNISKKTGVEIDAGPCFLLFHERMIKTINPWDFDINFPVMPSIGVTFFCRI